MKMGGMNKEQSLYENEIPDVHLRGTISTNLNSLESAMALLGHSGLVHNEEKIIELIAYFTDQNEKNPYQPDIRQKIAVGLANIVTFNERKHPDLAEKARVAMKAFAS
jgi:hypothetical protein